MAGILMGTEGKITRIEEVLVGVFGAFIGGDFLLSYLIGPTGSTMQALGMGAAGAAVMLVLLRVMRGVVGPMRNSKARIKQR